MIIQKANLNTSDTSEVLAAFYEDAEQHIDVEFTKIRKTDDHFVVSGYHNSKSDTICYILFVIKGGSCYELHVDLASPGTDEERNELNYVTECLARDFSLWFNDKTSRSYSQYLQNIEN